MQQGIQEHGEIGGEQFQVMERRRDNMIRESDNCAQLNRNLKISDNEMMDLASETAKLELENGSKRAEIDRLRAQLKESQNKNADQRHETQDLQEESQRR